MMTTGEMLWARAFSALRAAEVRVGVDIWSKRRHKMAIMGESGPVQ